MVRFLYDIAAMLFIFSAKIRKVVETSKFTQLFLVQLLIFANYNAVYRVFRIFVISSEDDEFYTI